MFKKGDIIEGRITLTRYLILGKERCLIPPRDVEEDSCRGCDGTRYIGMIIYSKNDNLMSSFMFKQVFLCQKSNVYSLYEVENEEN